MSEGVGTILIESNRKIAVSRVFGADESNPGPTNPQPDTQASKARWTTSLDTGIELEPGDQVSLEYAALNIPGLGDSMIEFKGRVDTKDPSLNQYLKDNQTNAEFQFYVTNRMEFNMPMPLSDMKVRRKLYSSTYGTPSLDGQREGNGLHKSWDGNYTGQAAGFSAFTAAYPYRAIPGVVWRNWDATNKKYKEPFNISTPVMDQASWGSGSGDKYHQYTPFVKGAWRNMQPTSDRLYIPQARDIGNDIIYLPFMDAVDENAGGAAQQTTTTAWTPFSNEVEFRLRAGNQTPARIGEVLASQMKARAYPNEVQMQSGVGGASNWKLRTIVPGTYGWDIPIGTTLPSGAMRQLTFTETNSVGGQTYMSFQTSTGYICRAKYLGPSGPANTRNGWSAHFDLEDGDTDAASKAGDLYRTDEAYRAIYNQLLVGNPNQWYIATRILPDLQYSSFITSYITPTGFPSPNPAFTSLIPLLWTGPNEEAEDERPLGQPNVKVGYFGNHPRMQSVITSKDIQVSAQLPLPTAPASSNSPWTWSYRATQVMKMTDLQHYEVIVTTMMYGGGRTSPPDISTPTGVMVGMIDGAHELLTEWTSDAPSPLSQSDDYYNSAYVTWLVGKIDDELSYPGAVIEGIPGANCFLSNDYLTYLYNKTSPPGSDPIFQGQDGITIESNGGASTGSYCQIPVKQTAAAGETPVTTICLCAWRNDLNERPHWPNLGYNNEAQQRGIRVYRYNPIPPGKPPITAQNLYDEVCDSWLVGTNFGAGKQWRTRPPNMTFEEYYDKIYRINGEMNNGRGTGVIPVFNWFESNHFLRNEPFLAVIAFRPDYQLLQPLPYIGEFFFPASPSFMQNNLSLPVSTQQTNTQEYPLANTDYSHMHTQSTTCWPSDVWTYANCFFAGSNDPLIEFTNAYSRFAISKMHTASFRGNGRFQRMDVEGGNSDADAIIMSTDAKPAAVSVRKVPKPKVSGTLTDVIYDPLNPPVNFNFNIISFADIEARMTPYATMSTQSGVALTGLTIPVDAPGSTPVTIGPWDTNSFRNTLFHKLGFRLQQLLPTVGQPNTQYNSYSHNEYFSLDTPTGLTFMNLCKPVTTNAAVSSSEQPSFVIGFGSQQLADGRIAEGSINLPLPAYNLGINYVNSATQANTDAIIAFDLPAKVSFPYLVCYSNIQSPCGFQYIGSASGQQMLSAIAYLSTNYTVQDFAYSFRSDLTFTVTKPYVVTEIITAIHFPTGEMAESVLGESSAVIYRIDRARRPLPLELGDPYKKDEDKKKDK